MFEGLSFGINLSSHTRAGFAALSVHVAVIAVAVYGSEQPTAAPRAVADTVPIELPRRPISEQASPPKKLSHGASVPSAPMVPAIPVGGVQVPVFAMHSARRDPGL